MTAGAFYVPGSSLLHRLDPRPKLLLVVAALLLAAASARPIVPGVLLAAVLAGTAATGTGRSLRRVRGLMLTVFVFSVVLWTLAPGLRVPLHDARRLATLLLGVTSGLKLAAMLASTVLFLSTTRVEMLTLGLIRLGLPYPAAFAFSTALRLAPSLVAAAVTIIQAQKSRGLDAESGTWLARARKNVPLLVPIVASALRSTNTFAMALEARGFRSRPGRTSLLTLRYTSVDWAATVLALVLLGWAFWLRAA